MSGQIKDIIDFIVRERAKGNPVIEKTTKTKLQLKGVNVGQFTSSSPDDAAVIEKLRNIAKEIGVTLQ